jgi:hypothetical protein
MVGSMAQLQARSGIAVEELRQHVVCTVVPQSIPPEQVYHQVPITARAYHVHVICCQGVPDV